MPNFCAAPNCTRKSTQSDLAFFRFPRDPNRCQKWVENCRRSDLEDKTPDQLNKHYRLCAQHFEDAMICRSSPYRTVLRENAIPTIFDLTSHLGNPGRRRKRIKELSEDEIRTLKERKRTEMVFGLPHSLVMASKPFLDIGLLIALVRLHPELYDLQNPTYHDPERRLRLWNQISSEMFMDWDGLNPQQRSMKVKEVQAQWQSLKENFRRELTDEMMHRRVPKHHLSPHFKNLLFLKPVVMPQEAESRRDPTTISDIKIVYVKEEPASPQTEVSSVTSSNRANISPQSTLEELCQNASGLPHHGQEEDTHMDFARSLVPYLSQVPESHQANLRMALANVIFCYIENTQGHSPTASPQLLRYISPQHHP